MNRYTQEQFIEKAKKIHGTKYDYSLVNYQGYKAKVVIVCHKHGKFEQSPTRHQQGRGCRKCGQVKANIKRTHTTESFISRASETHNNFYDYSKVNYTGALKKVIITCPKHGDFFQQASKHIDGRGCLKCSIDRGVKYNTIEEDEYLKKVIEVHGDIYIYDAVKYKGSQNPITAECRKHGKFTIPKATDFLQRGCKKCSWERMKLEKSTKFEDFVLQANKIHNNKFKYNKLSYINKSNDIEIICPTHGNFFQLGHSHIKGAGCPQCNPQRGWTLTEWINLFKTKNLSYGSVYVMGFTKNKESFIKVGMTSNLKNRIKDFTYGAKKYKITLLQEIKGTPLAIWNLEKKIHDLLNEYKYIPQIKFGGYTECFDFNATKILKESFIL